MGLGSWFRTKRALLDTIDDQKAEIDRLKDSRDKGWALANESGRLACELKAKLDAANARVARTRAASEDLCGKAEARELKLAELQHRVEQGEAVRKTLTDERNAAIGTRDHWIAESKSAHQRRVVAGKERDAAVKERDYWKARDAAWLTENDGIRKERDEAVKAGEFVESKARQAYGLVFKANAILSEIGVPEDTVDAPEPKAPLPHLNLDDDGF